ncbi:hypothetical protein C8R44DRAFT_881851 [Mycena epipterygia]|nr:hypothetical protein C8R44DRAFT_881851 [Mycena epipterygia]
MSVCDFILEFVVRASYTLAPPTLQALKPSSSIAAMEQTQSTAALSDQSPDWRSPTPPSPPPYIDPALIPDQDLLARYADFKHRVWLTWYSMQMYLVSSTHIARSSWLAIMEGTDSHGDLWLWEDGDEKWAKALCDTHYGDSAHPLPCPRTTWWTLFEHWKHLPEKLGHRQTICWLTLLLRLGWPSSRG